MITLLLHFFRLLPVLCGSHRHLALENLALRHQLAVYKQTLRRPKLHPSDRLLWVCLSRVWAEWRLALIMVTPDTVLRWHRRRFRDYWATLSSRPLVGRPSVNAEIIALVRKIAAANPLWGAPRTHGELLKLGIKVAERTVSRLIVKRRTPPSQTWRTFLTKHVQDLVSIDFFTVPTAQLRVLFVLVVLAHLGAGSFTSTSPSTPPRRGLLSISWTPFPTTAPAYLLRDRDAIYGEAFRQRVKGMQIREVLTAARSPWQNPFAERLIGSIQARPNPPFPHQGCTGSEAGRAT